MFKRLSNFISSHYISRYWILLIDVVASLIATMLVFWAVNFFTHVILSFNVYLYIAALSILVSLLVFSVFRTHYGVIRHTTLKEMWRISIAALLKGMIMYFIILFTPLGEMLTYHDLAERLFVAELADIILTLFILMMIRIFLANFYSFLVNKQVSSDTKKVFIYGDSDESVSVLGMIEKIYDSNYKCVGFLVPVEKGASSGGKNTGTKKMLCGYPVIQVENERVFQKAATSHIFNALIFPSYKSARKEKDRFIDFCTRREIEVLIKPVMNAVSEGENILAPIREVKIEDLLGRDEVSINMNEINSFLTDKVVLVTGAAGSIGSQLCRLLLTIPIQKLIMLDMAETPLHDLQLELRDKNPLVEKKFLIADVRSRARIESIFQRYSPNVVFHAAAYKHVPLMESNPCEAVNVNVFGTKKMADIAVKYGAEKFVMISTDKAVNPANVMGASKRIAEIYVQSLSKAIAAGVVKGKTKFVTTRFGNVLGSNGSVIPLFRKQIAEGGPVTVTDPRIVRYFMTIPEACRLVMEAATMGKGDEIFVFDMGEPVRILDLAKNMIKLAGLTIDEDIEIKFIGLRPGEKLYEELLNNAENTIPTIHKKIFLAKVAKYVYGDVEKSLEELKIKANEMSKEETVAIMKRIVPEFKSCNSRYGMLDQN